MKLKSASYPVKRTMNLYYKPDRTAKPATIALYVLFLLVVLLGLSKVMVYDLWVRVQDAQTELTAAEQQLEVTMASLTDFAEVQEKYRRYTPTGTEEGTIDRMEILSLLDHAVGATAEVDIVSVSGDAVQVQFSKVTLAQTAEIVAQLESSPIVESTTVNTASTTQEAQDLVSASVRIQLKKGGGEG